MPGIYRQTTETTGMYSPLKKHLHRAQQIIPSKNCATQKIIPSHAPLLLSQHRKVKYQPSQEFFRNSPSLSHLKHSVCDEESLEYDNFYQFYAQSRRDYDKIYEYPSRKHQPPPPPPLVDFSTRPYTPPEKRYNSNFGGHNEQEQARRQRPRSSCMYENMHVDNEYCIIKMDSDRNLNYTPNVKVTNFPVPEFSQMYIQNNYH